MKAFGQTAMSKGAHGREGGPVRIAEAGGRVGRKIGGGIVCVGKVECLCA